jgi:predicted transcriptional regulator
MMAGEVRMSAVKTEAIRLIEGLPDSSDWMDVAYRLYVRAKIEQGLADSRAGRVVPHDQVMREMDEWLSSLGPSQPSPTSDAS